MKLYEILSNKGIHARVRAHTHTHTHTYIYIWFNGKNFSYDL